MSVWGCVVSLVALLGHLALTRALVNALFRIYVPRWLSRFRFVGVGLLSLTVGGWMLGGIALGGPAIARTGRWEDVPLGWQLYMILCMVALPVGAVLNHIRRHRPPPRAQLSCRGEFADAVEALGRRPAGTFLGRLLSYLPRNQIYQPEFTHKEIGLARLPSQWDGLSILHLSDLHMAGSPDRSFYEWALARATAEPSDLIVCTGDILDDLVYRDWLPSTLGRLAAPLGCWFVLGNHDARHGPAQIRQAMLDIGWQHVGGRWQAIEHRGERLILGGCESPWLAIEPPLPPVEAGFRLLLSHGPRCFGWAASNGIDLMLAGHVHGGQVNLPLLGPVYGHGYDAGIFQAGPTVLHIVRGLGQLTPIRLHCRPEVTRLVLRRGN